VSPGRRGWPWRLAAAVCLSAGTLAGSVSPGQVAPPIRVLQINLCGSGIAACHSDRSVPTAADLIGAVRPDVVTLNEVCQDHVTALGRALDAARGGSVGWAFQAAWDRRTGAAFRCRDGQPYGIGVIVHSSRPWPSAARFGGLYPMQDARDPEERAWLCLDAGDYLSCTTHLAYLDPAVALAQCGHLFGTVIPSVRSRSASAPTVIGADLNLRWGSVPDGRPCVPSGYRRVGDEAVQHVVASTEFTIRATRLLDLAATTDHSGLLVVLQLRHRG
jgi:hypothetical protein